MKTKETQTNPILKYYTKIKGPLISFFLKWIIGTAGAVAISFMIGGGQGADERGVPIISGYLLYNSFSIKNKIVKILLILFFGLMFLGGANNILRYGIS